MKIWAYWVMKISAIKLLKSGISGYLGSAYKWHPLQIFILHPISSQLVNLCSFQSSNLWFFFFPWSRGSWTYFHITLTTSKGSNQFNFFRIPSQNFKLKIFSINRWNELLNFRFNVSFSVLQSLKTSTIGDYFIFFATQVQVK